MQPIVLLDCRSGDRIELRLLLCLVMLCGTVSTAVDRCCTLSCHLTFFHHSCALGYVRYVQTRGEPTCYFSIGSVCMTERFTRAEDGSGGDYRLQEPGEEGGQFYSLWKTPLSQLGDFGVGVGCVVRIF